MNSIDGYDDIHNNLRYWMTNLAKTIVDHKAEGPAVLFDIGANDGELSLPVMRDVGPVSPGDAAVSEGSAPLHVVAFEPLPAARARLINRCYKMGLTVALWGTADVTVIPLALGNEDRMIDINVYDDDTFSSLYNRSEEEMERYHLNVTESVRLRMRPLDDLVAAGTVPPPDIVKIDVEGAELAVLKGAAETLRAHHPPIVMEFSCINTANAGYERKELLKQLSALGYDEIYGLFRNEDRSLYRGDAFDDCRIWNVIAFQDETAPGADLVAQHRADWIKR